MIMVCRISVGLCKSCLPILIVAVCLTANAGAQRSEPSVAWTVAAEKAVYFPGEPVLLTLQIRNNGPSKERVNLGTDDIGGFSFEIYDDSNQLVARGDKIVRGGLGRSHGAPIPPGQTGKKAVVLNQWCSTQLPPGRYRVVCQVCYSLRSEGTWDPDEETFRAAPDRATELELPITLVKAEEEEVTRILKELGEKATAVHKKGEKRTFRQYYQERECAREMLAFTDWEAAVPYQLQILEDGSFTWLKKDIILALTRSETPEAATGLIAILARNPKRNRDVEHDIIRAVYELRDTGKEEIIQATAEFTSQHKRPYMPPRKGRSASGP